MNKKLIIGVDTSNYTTSLAALDTNGNLLANVKYPLKVAEGGRGLRQSDAVFAHTKNLPLAIESLSKLVDIKNAVAVGYSSRPRSLEGAYMPCFLAGVAAASSLAAASGARSYAFSHQDGHIRAAAYSAGFEIKSGSEFAAFHVSGGTTELLCVTSNGDALTVHLIGETKDLNAGQLIDRIGVKMGYPFPCGAALDELALSYGERVKGIKTSVNSMNCNLSGGENIALKLINEGKSEAEISAYVFSFIAKTLVKMTEALRESHPDIPVIYAGGVMGSKYIRSQLNFKNVYFAEPQFSADNAVGVALLAYEKYKSEEKI